MRPVSVDVQASVIGWPCVRPCSPSQAGSLGPNGTSLFLRSRRWRRLAAPHLRIGLFPTSGAPQCGEGLASVLFLFLVSVGPAQSVEAPIKVDQTALCIVLGPTGLDGPPRCGQGGLAPLGNAFRPVSSHSEPPLGRLLGVGTSMFYCCNQANAVETSSTLTTTTFGR